jgi:DUF2950 family protein
VLTRSIGHSANGSARVGAARLDQGPIPGVLGSRPRSVARFGNCRSAHRQTEADFLRGGIELVDFHGLVLEQPVATVEHLFRVHGCREDLPKPGGAQPESPAGPWLTAAAAEGYTQGTAAPYHGYLFRMLFEQRAAASGGARRYIVGDKLENGFAVLAYPAPTA